MPLSNSARVTIDDVARAAGVSAMTVSRVLNDSGRVAEATAARVRTAITRLNYIPHQGARALAGRKTNTVGLIFPEITDVFFFELIRGIQLGVSRHGFDLLLYSTAQSGSPELLHLPLGEHNTDGLIVFTDSLDAASLRRLHAHGFPMVLLHQTPPVGLDIPTVTFENKQGAFQMTSHLLRCGHRRIAFLTGLPGNEDAAWREAGYREALAAAGVPLDPNLIGMGGFDNGLAREVVAGWLASGREMDAIFAGDDVSARGVLEAIHAAGLRVPQDIAVAGFDDALLSRYLDPPLTTVRAPIEEAGRVAAAQLLQLIQTGHATPLTLLPTELVIRQSCGWQRRQAALAGAPAGASTES